MVYRHALVWLEAKRKLKIIMQITWKPNIYVAYLDVYFKKCVMNFNTTKLELSPLSFSTSCTCMVCNNIDELQSCTRG